MEPTKKSPKIEEFLEKTFKLNRITSIKSNLCVFCKLEVTSFPDTLSEKEFSISGICPSCWDETFGEEDDDR